MFPGIGMDPKKLAAVQEISKKVSAEIEVDYAEKTIKLSFSSTDDDALQVVDYLVNLFPDNLAKQLSSFFAISGEIIEKNKPVEKS